MRNLDGFEIAGRKLRVDNACTEKSRMEMQNLLQVSFNFALTMTKFQLVDQEPVAESPFGPPCEPARAPETISRAVASLPPEQMFQLMQQMKLCIQNNPSEARTMLMQNPQLAYALLQAQVVMRIVDPETAVQMLHKTPPTVPPVGIDPTRPPMSAAPPNFGGPQFPPMGGPAGTGLPLPGGAFGQNGPQGGMRGMEPVGPRMEERRGFSGPPGGMEMEGIKQEGGGMRRDPRDPRSRDPRDRGGSAGPGSRGGAPPQQMPGMRGGPPPPQGPPPVRPPQLPPHLAGADPEKAALIMQVLVEMLVKIITRDGPGATTDR